MICLGIETTAHTFGVGIVNDNKEILANVIEGLMDDEDGIVDHGAHQDDESEHGHDVQGLGRHKSVHQAQSHQSAGRGQGHGEHDDQGVEKIFKEG